MNTVGWMCSRIQDQQIVRKGENRSASTHLQSVTSATRFDLALARWAYRPSQRAGYVSAFLTGAEAHISQGVSSEGIFVSGVRPRFRAPAIHGAKPNTRIVFLDQSSSRDLKYIMRPSAICSSLEKRDQPQFREPEEHFSVQEPVPVGGLDVCRQTPPKSSIIHRQLITDHSARQRFALQRNSGSSPLRLYLLAWLPLHAIEVEQGGRAEQSSFTDRRPTAILGHVESIGQSTRTSANSASVTTPADQLRFSS
jgi:hypothetical protein